MRLEDSEIFQHVAHWVGVPSIDISNWTHWKEIEMERDNEVFLSSIMSVDPQFWYWVGDTFWFSPLVALGIYFYVNFQLKRFMEHRKPISGNRITIIMAVYNLILVLSHALALNSLIGIIWRQMVHPDWIHRTLCDRSLLKKQEVFWVWIIGAGKYVMLLDTIFMVLKKKMIYDRFQKNKLRKQKII